MKMTDRYQLVVWNWNKLKTADGPKMVKNEFGISRKKVVELRAFYEEKGFEVHSWVLSEDDLKRAKS